MSMKNVKMRVVHGKRGARLIVSIDLTTRLGDSKSGKSTIVASTGGCVEVPEHSNMRIGVNVFEKA